MKGSASRGQARRDGIANAALQLFLERGFGVSVDEVAQAAGASKQTIYKFFGGREGLIGAAMQSELEAVVGPMRQAAKFAGSPEDRLERFAQAYQDTLFADNCLAMYRFVIGATREHPGLSTVFNETVVEYLSGLVEPAVAAATGADPVRSREIVQMYLGILQGTELNRALAGMSPDASTLAGLRAEAVRAVLKSQ
ncbi:TetR/AcrR family transcriptional regulator [Demequina sp. TTPB684]|uniref:TetR/AcrR family transcriptional regulator n=1 Tax=unclassified Demequina TaxID=2620311 RepID=UPI001CF31D96|nr:TetR/AcrR family transcriptional regulator [Demequina sp. TMPB413]MCB2412236.1 TetR/AcrR family transcriptional regulator [Demequina sp. TTPB684]UPU87782.1 TetR/AcrR family transcriptional regulator [Demequina sp. TMPB413]